MKKVKNNDGIAPWKIDNAMERWLSRAADKSELGKILYVKFYEIFDHDYFVKGQKFIDRNIKAVDAGIAYAKENNLYFAG